MRGPNCTLLAGRQEKLAEEFEVQLKLAGLRKEVQVMRGGCLGLCSSGPNVAVFPEGTIYSHVHVEDVAEIVSEHLLKGGRVDRLLYNENEATSTVRSLEETEFYKKQLRIALRNCGVIDPQNIDEYIARDGYAALEKCLTELTPDEVIQIVLDSGLRGRGGAGFPTGLKWRFASGERGQVQKYVCCNADEGDPGGLHGPQRAGGRPPRCHRGHDHRGLCHRRAAGLYLRPRGVPHRGEAPPDRSGAGQELRTAGGGYLRDGLLLLTWRSSWGRGLSYAGKRPP